MKKTVKKTDKVKQTTQAKEAKEKKPLLKLTQVRKSRGLSLNKLGKELGISGSHLDRIEKGQNELSVSRLLDLCSALKASADELVDIPMRGKAAKSNHDPALLATVLDTIFETAETLGLTPSGEEISKWGSYVYEEVLAENLDFKQTKSLAAQVVKISTKLQA